MMDFIKVLLSALSVLSVLVSGEDIQIKDNSTDKQPFQLDEFLRNSFYNKPWNGTWISDNVFLAKNQEDIYKVNVDSRTSDFFLESQVFDDYPGSFTLSPDQKYILLLYNVKAVFRHSTAAQFTIYDIENKTYHDVANKTYLQLAKWAPVGNGLVYVLENNIYYIPSPKDVANPHKITNDGISGIIYNGVADWVYEEEVLGSGSAVWFSPNGKRLAFASFDDKKVNDFHYFIYGKPGEIESQYPELITLKYPKVGATNPTVSVKYVDLESLNKTVTTLESIIPVNDVSKDHVLQDITWATDVYLVAVSLNRVQNLSAIVRCNVETQECNQKTIYKETRGWLNIKSPLYNDDGSKFLLLLPQPEGNDTFSHIVLHYNNGTNERLTRGERVVKNIYGWDTKRGLIYYASTIEDEPSQQHVYVLDVKTKEELCLTCNYLTPEGLCKVASADFSSGFSNYAKICNGPGPRIIQVHSLQNLSYFVWEENDVLRSKLKYKLAPIKKNLKVPLANGLVARVRLLLPPGLNESDTVKYPLLVNVYAGPDSNRISEQFSTGVENYFVTNRRYIYAYIDARGSGLAGGNLMFSVYRNLGTVEIEDQINVTKYLQDNLPYVDATKTGIWGWSYGGFSTIWALIKDKRNVFQLGLSVAPVTSFIYYDSIYTERYMGLPTDEDNLAGYINTDVTRHVNELKNKSLFLIHGNADDNVHYQQSMLFAKALETADIPFRQQSYPDENHSLAGVSPHLYHNIDQFFNAGFRGKNSKKRRFRRTRV